LDGSLEVTFDSFVTYTGIDPTDGLELVQFQAPTVASNYVIFSGGIGIGVTNPFISGSLETCWSIDIDGYGTGTVFLIIDYPTTIGQCLPTGLPSSCPVSNFPIPPSVNPTPTAPFTLPPGVAPTSGSPTGPVAPTAPTNSPPTGGPTGPISCFQGETGAVAALTCAALDFIGNPTDSCLSVPAGSTCSAFLALGNSTKAFFNSTVALYGCISSDSWAELQAGFGTQAACTTPALTYCSASNCNNPPGVPTNAPTPGSPPVVGPSSTPTKAPTAPSEGRIIYGSFISILLLFVLTRLV